MNVWRITEDVIISAGTQWAVLSAAVRKDTNSWLTNAPVKVSHFSHYIVSAFWVDFQIHILDVHGSITMTLYVIKDCWPQGKNSAVWLAFFYGTKKEIFSKMFRLLLYKQQLYLVIQLQAQVSIKSIKKYQNGHECCLFYSVKQKKGDV